MGSGNEQWQRPGWRTQPPNTSQCRDNPEQAAHHTLVSTQYRLLLLNPMMQLRIKDQPDPQDMGLPATTSTASQQALPVRNAYTRCSHCEIQKD